MVSPIVRAILEFLIIFTISLFAYYFLLYIYNEDVSFLLEKNIASYDMLALRDIINYYVENCPSECFIEIYYPNFLKYSFSNYKVYNKSICFFVENSKVFCQNTSYIYICKRTNEKVKISLKIKNKSIKFLRIC